MTAAGDLLAQLAPAVVRLTRWPGTVLLTTATLAVGGFAALGLARGLQDDGGSWVPLVLAALLAVPVVTLAWRRWRLERQVEGLEQPHRTVGGAEIVRTGADAAVAPWENDLEALTAAMDEAQVRRARFLPRVEAAQRAALRAAGGPVNAPYLRDDLRVTIVALLGTLLAVPLGFLGVVVTGLALLAG